MRITPKKIAMSFLSVLAILLGSLAMSPQYATASKIDTSAPVELGLLPCESTSELDCIESFGFLDKGDNYQAAKLVKTSVNEPYRDQNGNTVRSAQTSWESLVDGQLQRALLSVPLQSPSFVLFRNPGSGSHYGASLRPWVDGADLLNIKVRFVVRTSYLQPQNVQLVADEADFKQVKLPGGNAWMFEGKGTQVSTYTNDVQKKSQDWSAKADLDTTTLHFIVHHADSDLSRGYWPAPCAKAGYSVQAFNSNAAGEPYWNAREQSLEFAVPSPHLMASGKTNTGFFKLWTTDAYMKCQWKGNNLASANGISVSVVNQDGSTQTATTIVKHSSGRLYVEATGFHYSAPKIKISASKKKSKITCVSLKNSRITKTVVGFSPKCPSGYSIKK